jgi:Brp/Blh family beta-carotene 15,15'-monooxygenase
MLPTPIELDEAEAQLARAAGRALPGWRAVDDGHQEAGLLPMTPRDDDVPINDGVVRLGVAGGACRPSTGYAFLQIQRQTEAVARQLAAGEPIAVPRRPWVVRYLDAVFLRRMRRDPKAFPPVFAGLFGRVRPDRLARFLADVPRSGDVAAIIWAMPKLPFAGEALFHNQAADWLRRDSWSAHNGLAIAATGVFTFIAAILMWLGPVPIGVQAVVLVVAASIGMAHGATDVWLGRQLFGDEFGGRLRFGGGYVLVALLALAVYVASPGVWLVGFLLLSALHFGLGELPRLMPRSMGEAGVSVVRGLMPLSLPALWHGEQVAWALGALAGPDISSAASATLSHLAWPILGAASILVILSLLKRCWVAAGEVVVVVGALVVLPPLLGFAIYFAIWHSARHLLSDVIDAPRAGARARKPWGPVAVATVAPVALAVVAWLLLWLVPVATPDNLAANASASGSAVRVVFVTLGCLTLPHMALVAVAAWRRTRRDRPGDSQERTEQAKQSSDERFVSLPTPTART